MGPSRDKFMMVEGRLNKVDPPYEAEQRSIPRIVELILPSVDRQMEW